MGWMVEMVYISNILLFLSVCIACLIKLQTYLQQVLNSEPLDDWKVHDSSLCSRSKKVFDLLSEQKITDPNLRKQTTVFK